MRYLRWVTFVAGLVLMAFAVVNLDSVFTTDTIQEELPTPRSPSSFRQEMGTYNLFPPFMGIVGLGLVSFAVAWTRTARKPD